MKRLSSLSVPSTDVIVCKLLFSLSQEKFNDTKGIRSRKSKNDRHYNNQKKMDKRTNRGLQNTTQKTKD
jgi:hypothetical protein